MTCWTLMMNPDVIHSLAAEAASAVEPIKAKMAGSVPVERSSQRATNEVEPNKQKKSNVTVLRVYSVLLRVVLMYLSMSFSIVSVSEAAVNSL